MLMKNNKLEHFMYYSSILSFTRVQATAHKHHLLLDARICHHKTKLVRAGLCSSDVVLVLRQRFLECLCLIWISKVWNNGTSRSRDLISYGHQCLVHMIITLYNVPANELTSSEVTVFATAQQQW